MLGLGMESIKSNWRTGSPAADEGDGRALGTAWTRGWTGWAGCHLLAIAVLAIWPIWTFCTGGFLLRPFRLAERARRLVH